MMRYFHNRTQAFRILMKYVTFITKELAIILRTMECRRHFQRLKKDTKSSLEMKTKNKKWHSDSSYLEY